MSDILTAEECAELQDVFMSEKAPSRYFTDMEIINGLFPRALATIGMLRQRFKDVDQIHVDNQERVSGLRERIRQLEATDKAHVTLIDSLERRHTKDEERIAALEEEKRILMIPPKEGPCYYCGEMTNSYGGNPGKWLLVFPHKEEPGRAIFHHTACHLERVSALEVENDHLKTCHAEVLDELKDAEEENERLRAVYNELADNRIILLDENERLHNSMDAQDQQIIERIASREAENIRLHRILSAQDERIAVLEAAITAADKSFERLEQSGNLVKGTQEFKEWQEKRKACGDL